MIFSVVMDNFNMTHLDFLVGKDLYMRGVYSGLNGRLHDCPGNGCVPQLRPTTFPEGSMHCKFGLYKYHAVLGGRFRE